MAKKGKHLKPLFDYRFPPCFLGDSPTYVNGVLICEQTTLHHVSSY